jgi:hypothetical protein
VNVMHWYSFLGILFDRNVSDQQTKSRHRLLGAELSLETINGGAPPLASRTAIPVIYAISARLPIRPIPQSMRQYNVVNFPWLSLYRILGCQDVLPLMKPCGDDGKGGGNPTVTHFVRGPCIACREPHAIPSSRKIMWRCNDSPPTIMSVMRLWPSGVLSVQR